MGDESHPHPSRLVITDLVTNINQLNDLERRKTERTPRNWLDRCLNIFSILNPSVWIILTLLGMLTALLGFIVDFVGEKLLESRAAFAFSSSSSMSFLVWVVYSLSFAFVAAGSCLWISQEAEGSGIPEMKSILSGVRMPKYLSFQTLAAKVIGLISAYSSGMSIGREGPFVHIAGIIANRLMKLKCFRHVNSVTFTQNETLRNQILAASVAAGIAATFGAPIGGVLFSIEVTSTYYVVNNMWKAFFCSVWCCLMFMLLKMNAIADLLTNTKFELFEFDWEVGLYALLGVICGAVGAVFVHMTHRMIYIRKHQQIPFFCHRFRYTLTVAFLCSICTYQAGFLQLPDKDVLKYTFQDRRDEGDDTWEEPNTGFNLLIYALCKLLMTVVSYSTPVPCGIFIPTFTGGAALGRLYGYIVNAIWTTKHLGVYSVIGAAALTSSVTHTISVAVIVFELTGDMHYMLAMLIAVLLSFAVGNALSASIYDYLFEMKKLPYLPTVKSSNLYSKKAGDLVTTDQSLFRLNRNSTLIQLAEVLEGDVSSIHKLPIVDDEMQLVADVSLLHLRKYLISRYMRSSQLFPFAAKRKLDRYFERLYQNSDGVVTSAQIELISAKNIFRNEEESKGDPSEVSEFWGRPIEWNSALIELDEAPLSVSECTPLAKVHFMFMMLGLPQIYVIKRGALIGYITRESFSKNGT